MSEVKDFNSQIIDEFRENEGKVGGPFKGAPILLLHTKGRKSGKPRVNPLAYQPVDGAYAVFGSMGGAPVDPEWVRNALANGDVEAEIGTDTVKLRAREATGDERDRIWTKQKELMPGFAEYEAATQGVRDIPVIVLEKT